MSRKKASKNTLKFKKYLFKYYKFENTIFYSLFVKTNIII